MGAGLPLDLGTGAANAAAADTQMQHAFHLGAVEHRTKLLRQVVTALADGAMAVHMAEEYLASQR